MTYIYYILLASLLMACEKDTVIDTPMPPEVEKSIIEIDWVSLLNDKMSVVNLSEGVFYDNWYLYPDDDDSPTQILAFHKVSGDNDWSISLDSYSGGGIIHMYTHEHMLIARNSHYIFGIDLETQSVKWDVNLKVEDIRLGRGLIASNGKYYLEGAYAWNSGSQVQRLYEFDPFTGINNIVFSDIEDSIGLKTISPPTFTIDAISGRELLIFNYRPNDNTPPQETIQDIMAIDATTHEEVWRSSVNMGFASNGLHPPVIYNDLVITGGDWSMYAYDINTGEQRWKYSFDYPWAIWGNTNHLIFGDKLFVNNGQRDVTCLNPMTGELIWNNANGGSNCTDNMLYYEKEDLLVFTSWGFGSVMVLDAITGETVHREGPYEGSNFNNDVVYDPETDMFFTSTFKHAIGFRVKRPE